MGDVLDLADKLWRGEAATDAHHPVTRHGGFEDLGDGTAFVQSFANVSAFDTAGGLLLMDTGSQFFAQAVHETLRAWTASPLDTAVYSHGHIDHVFGVANFEAEAAERGWRAPNVIAHEHLPARFDRYILTNGYNAIINQRQFRAPNLRWPTEYRYPRYHLPRPPRRGGRWKALRTAPRDGRDRRRDVVVVANAQGALPW